MIAKCPQCGGQLTSKVDHITKTLFYKCDDCKFAFDPRPQAPLVVSAVEIEAEVVVMWDHRSDMKVEKMLINGWQIVATLQGVAFEGDPFYPRVFLTRTIDQL